MGPIIPTPYTLESEMLESMTDAQFLRFCEDNPSMRFERTADKKILIMSPTGTQSSFWNGELFFQLKSWARSSDIGYCFESSGGFALPDGSIKAPDLAWIRRERWESVAAEDRKGFAPICPDFVLELRSPSDQLKVLQAKMESWIANGAQLAFLIDPQEQVSYLYRADGSSETVTGFAEALSGEAVLPGFALDLRVLLP